jgi:hypothetical protein
LSIRDVERFSQQIVEEKNNPAYPVPHNCVSDLENGKSKSRLAKDVLYEYVGTDDYTLDRIIRPGVFAQVDPYRDRGVSVNSSFSVFSELLRHETIPFGRAGPGRAPTSARFYWNHGSWNQYVMRSHDVPVLRGTGRRSRQVRLSGGL